MASNIDPEKLSSAIRDAKLAQRNLNTAPKGVGKKRTKVGATSQSIVNLPLLNTTEGKHVVSFEDYF